MIKKIFIILMITFLVSCNTSDESNFDINKGFDVSFIYEFSEEEQSFQTLSELFNYIQGIRDFTFYFDNEFTKLFVQEEIKSNRFSLYARDTIYLNLKLAENNPSLYRSYDHDLLSYQLSKFNQKYPYIKVNKTNSISNSDVFINENISESIRYGLDLSTLWINDLESKDVFKYLADAGLYSEKRFLLPMPQELKGIMINLDIFKSRNLTSNSNFRIDQDGYPVKDWTLNEFIEIAKAIKDFDLSKENYYDENYVLGLDTWYGFPDFHHIIPGCNSSEISYNSWNGTNFEFTNELWKSAMALSLEIHSLEDGTVTTLSNRIMNDHPELNQHHILNGTAAMDIEGSTQFWVINEAKENGINLGFWPYPSGSEGFYPPSMLDYLGVNKNTKHIQESYILAKWLSYGTEGYNSLIEFQQDRYQYISHFPVSSDPDTMLKLKQKFTTIQGLEFILSNLENSKPDLSKMIPGYMDFIRWTFEYHSYSQMELRENPSMLDDFALNWELKAKEIIDWEFFILKDYLT